MVGRLAGFGARRGWFAVGATGGETDDGETDDGETDDGETDDGETDDGETDDGETDETGIIEKRRRWRTWGRARARGLIWGSAGDVMDGWWVDC